MFEGSHALQIADAVAVPCPDAVTVGFTQVRLHREPIFKRGSGCQMRSRTSLRAWPRNGRAHGNEPPGSQNARIEPNYLLVFNNLSKLSVPQATGRRDANTGAQS